MGREIKRVALDFNWPLGEIWSGYVYPSDGTVECRNCLREGRAEGYSRLGQAMFSLSDFEAPYRILPGDSDKLVKTERVFMRALKEATGPEDLALSLKHYGPDYLPYVYGGGRSQITDSRMLAYDLMRHLAESLKVSFEETFLCSACKGSGRVIVDQVQHDIAEAWVETEPPAGEGWQVWETVSEGSPLTPVFATAEGLVNHLCTKGTKWSSDHYSREAAEAFVKSGWVPSMVIQNGVMYKDIQSAVLQSAEGGE